MIEGQPDWERFARTIQEAIGEIHTFDGKGVRAYGEMVGLLWARGQFAAAIRLEDFWNRLVKSHRMRLFCGYPIDIFDSAFNEPAISPILSAHTRVISAGASGNVHQAVGRAARQVLESADYEDLRAQFTSLSEHLPSGERAILWLRENFPHHANNILPWARAYYKDEVRFRALVEHSSDAIALLDEQAAIMYASPSTSRVLGYEPEELIGRNTCGLVHPEDLEITRTALRDVLKQTGIPVTVQARVLRKDGRWTWVDSTATNFLSQPDIRAVVANFRDISERKTAEEERERAMAELARSNAELQALAYAAAHDLREPLRTICAYTELLLEDPQSNHRHDYSEVIIEGVKRMSGLLDDLLTFTRLTVDEAVEAIDLRRPVEQAIMNLARTIEESRAKITVAASLPRIRASEAHMVQVFQNLISNAVKYRGATRPEIEILAERQSGEWIVKIRDNGIGIAPQYHQQIFGLFKRLHGQHVPGTGIGLAICKKIIEGLGGKIWVESTLGKGSIFCFTVTAIDNHNARSPEDPAYQFQEDGNRITEGRRDIC